LSSFFITFYFISIKNKDRERYQGKRKETKKDKKLIKKDEERKETENKGGVGQTSNISKNDISGGSRKKEKVGSRA
jgi:hypothetical protein